MHFFFNPLLLILLMFHFTMIYSSTIAFSPNFRFHAAHQNTSFNYSYANVKYLKGYKLNSVPITNFTTTNRKFCVKGCLSMPGLCKSMNVEKNVTGRFMCEILGTDVYGSRQNLVRAANWTHYVLVVSLFLLRYTFIGHLISKIIDCKLERSLLRGRG